MNKCPCGSNQSFVECCEPYLKGSVKAPTAEKLMRARYTAFATANVDYIEGTTDPSARSTFDRSGTEAWAKQSEWLGLQIVSKDLGEEKDSQGIVEFIARYKVEGVEHNHHERSQFKKRNGEWFFLDGRLVQEPVRVVDKAGRNDPCPCGSGKKYKKCCGTAA